MAIFENHTLYSNFLKKDVSVLGAQTFWLDSVLQPRFQGLSSSHLMELQVGRKRRGPGNEVQCFILQDMNLKLGRPKKL